jgi:hypothetical protein
MSSSECLWYSIPPLSYSAGTGLELIHELPALNRSVRRGFARPHPACRGGATVRDRSVLRGLARPHPACRGGATVRDKERTAHEPWLHPGKRGGGRGALRAIGSGHEPRLHPGKRGGGQAGSGPGGNCAERYWRGLLFSWPWDAICRVTSISLRPARLATTSRCPPLPGSACPVAGWQHVGRQHSAATRR